MSKRSKVTIVMLILNGLLMILSSIVMKYELNMDSTLVLTVESVIMGLFTSVDEVKDSVYRYFCQYKKSFQRKWNPLIIEVLGVCWFICIKATPVKKFVAVLTNEWLFQMKVCFWYAQWKMSLFYSAIK